MVLGELRPGLVCVCGLIQGEVEMVGTGRASPSKAVGVLGSWSIIAPADVGAYRRLCVYVKSKSHRS